MATKPMEAPKTASSVDLPSRQAIGVCFESARKSAQSRLAAVLCIGIDNAVSINQSLGYPVGDHYISTVVARLRSAILAEEQIVRHSESVIGLIMGSIEPGDIRRRCDELIEALSPPMILDGLSIKPSFSIGISIYPNDGDSPEALLRYADIALSSARRRASGEPVFYSAEMGRGLADRLSAESALQGALENDSFTVRYRPVYHLRKKAVQYFATEVQWRDDFLGTITMQQFFDSPGDAVLSCNLVEAVLRRIAKDALHWKERTPEPVPMLVPLAAQLLGNDRCFPRLRDAIGATVFHASDIIFEIDEAKLPLDRAQYAEVLRQLKDWGFGVAVHNYKARLPLAHHAGLGVSYVHLADSLAAQLCAEGRTNVLAGNIVAGARAAGVPLLIDKVERPDQLVLASEAGFDLAAGVYLGSPKTAEQSSGLVGDKLDTPEDTATPVPQRERRLLLVDDEQNIVSALKRLLRKDGYTIYSAFSGPEALTMLDKIEVDVIVSDQRMPGMLGADFLRAARLRYPNTVRIMLSGYTELQSVTDAVNEGAIYKFLTKPWDDELLRAHIAEAFRIKFIADENAYLAEQLKSTNDQLATANLRLADLLDAQQQRLTQGEISLTVAQEALQVLPVPVLGADEHMAIVFMNMAAKNALGIVGAVLGRPLADVLPGVSASSGEISQQLGSHQYRITVDKMGGKSTSRGFIICLHRIES